MKSKRLYSVTLLVLGLYVTLITAPGAAQDKAQNGASSSIPVPEIANRAEEVSALLRNVEALLAPDAGIEAIRQRLPDLSKQIGDRMDETTRKLEGRPSIETLDELLGFWQKTRSELAIALEKLTQRATRLEEELSRLSETLDVWKRARTEAQASKAPQAVLKRIDDILAAIPGIQGRLRSERSATLELQDKVARLLAQSDGGLDRVASFRQGYVGQILARDALPIWSREAQEQAFTDIAAHARESYSASVAHLREFIREESGGLLLLVIPFIALIVLLRVARRRTHLQHLADERGFSVELVFSRPVATALLIAMVTFFVAYPHPPRSASVLVSLIALTAVIRSVAPLVQPRQIRWLYALGAFFLGDQIRGLFAVMPRFERQLFLLEMLVGGIAAGWNFSRNLAAVRRGEQWSTGSPKRIAAATGLLTIGFAIAFLAGATGFMSLGRQVGYGTLGSAYAALALSASVRVAYGLVVLLLRVRPLAPLQSVRRHRALLEDRSLTLIRWIAIGLWMWATLSMFGLLSPIATLTREVLTAEFGWGSLTLSLGDVISFVITVWVTFLLSRFIRFVLEEDVYPHVQLAPGLSYAISSLLHYVILLIGFLMAMSALGMDLNRVTIIGGAFGVGIGFGLQNVVNNFVSGLILLFERPIRVGDAVQIADVSGEVRRIGIRSTTVRTWEGAEVIVPNASLVSDKVTNWTPTQRWRRVSLPISVTYGSDPEKVLEVLRRVAGGHPQVVSNPPPQPLFMAFGESALLFELRVWTDGFSDWMKVRSELAVALNAALREAGIEIAFPVREVVLRHDDGQEPLVKRRNEGAR